MWVFLFLFVRSERARNRRSRNRETTREPSIALSSRGDARTGTHTRDIYLGEWEQQQQQHRAESKESGESVPRGDSRV